MQLFDQVFRGPELQIVRLTPELFDRAVALYARRPDKEWSLTDCISFIVMQDHDIVEALTADRDFVQAGFQVLLV
jgi:predicted nucleic acid-binding protein